MLVFELKMRVGALLCRDWVRWARKMRQKMRENEAQNELKFIKARAFWV